MRRPLPSHFPVPLLLTLLLLAAAILPPGGSGAQAPASPAALPTDRVDEAAPLREVLIRTALEALPETPTVVRLLRITIPPGGSLPLYTLTGPELIHVEAGAVAVRLEGDAVVAPASDPGTPQPALVPPVGEEILLTPGDQLALPAAVPIAFRNDGPDPTTLLTVLFLPVDGAQPPELQWVEVTPSAETLGGTTSRVLGEAVAESWPAGPILVVVDRLALAPGQSIPGQNGPVLLAVEAGGFAFALLEGRFQVARGADGLQPEATPGTTYALNPGDSVFFPESLADVARPDDRQLLVLLRLSVLPVDGGAPVGTPTATRTAGASSPVATSDLTPTSVAPTETAETPGASTFPVGAAVLVSETGVRLRSDPAVDADVAAEFFADRELVVTGPPEENDGILWYPVVAADDPAVVGYIAEEFLLPAPE